MRIESHIINLNRGATVSSGEHSFEEKVVAYVHEYTNKYKQICDEHYSDSLKKAKQIDMLQSLFPLYEVTPAEAGYKALSTEKGFFVFFTSGIEHVAIDARKNPKFDASWYKDVSDKVKYEQILAELDLTEENILQAATIGGVSFIDGDYAVISENGISHGRQAGKGAAEYVESHWLTLVMNYAKLKNARQFEETYNSLKTSSTLTPQKRGIEFESLWRDILDTAGWMTKKIRLAGEENDFTAIFNTSHILGEVRWFAEPMTGGKIREFASKLDPRPQTIGLIISYSGFDEGARIVARRVANSKTVLFWEKTHIERIIVERESVGSVFSETLRDAYDFIFEDGTELFDHRDK